LTLQGKQLRQANNTTHLVDGGVAGREERPLHSVDVAQRHGLLGSLGQHGGVREIARAGRQRPDRVPVEKVVETGKLRQANRVEGQQS